MQVLTVKNLNVARENQPILSALNFQLEANQRLFLQGEIGTGKTTLLHCLLGFVPFQGEIHWFGNLCQQESDFVPFRGRVGICFQQPEDQLFGPTVLDDVAFGVLNQGVQKAKAYEIALAQLEQLGIAHLKDRAVNVLSGGEKNFTALAGVLAMKPQVLLLDEPTNGLDQKNCQKLTALLQELKLPMIIASHDQAFTKKMADVCLNF